MSIYFGLACVHDSPPICHPILIKFGTWIHFAKRKSKFFLVTQPEVIYAHAHNLTAVFSNLLKMPLNGGLQVKYACVL